MTAVDWDLVIVGAGPAGCATALFLQHASPELARRTLIIDRAEFPRDKICAGAIGARADRLLASIGVSVGARSASIAGIGVATRFGEKSARALQPIGRVVRRREFDAALLEQVQARDLAVRTGVALSGIRLSADRALLETSAGTLSARAVVGADGVASAVRRLCGFARGALHAQAVEVDAPAPPGDRNDLLWFDLTDARYVGYGWIFPTPLSGQRMVTRGIYRLTRGGPREEHAPPDIAELLAADLAEAGIAADFLRFRRFSERGLCLAQPCSRPRVLLVGEAAGIDPVLGEGIAQAIFYGRTAAAYLARAFSRGDLGFGDWPRALGRSRVGLDLRVRAAAVPFIYGRTRPLAERWLASSRALATAGMRYFAGERVPRRLLVRAGADLLRAPFRVWR